MLKKIKFALAAGTAIALTSAAFAMPEVAENKIDHRYPFLAAAQPSTPAGAFARADLPRRAKAVTQIEEALFDRATRPGW